MEVMNDAGGVCVYSTARLDVVVSGDGFSRNDVTLPPLSSSNIPHFLVSDRYQMLKFSD